MAESNWHDRNMIHVIRTMRDERGVAEDDEDGLMDMIMELIAADDPSHGGIDDNEMYGEDGVYEGEYVDDYEWTGYEESEEENGSEGDEGGPAASNDIMRPDE
jgi:hypothetical protein